MNTMFSFQRLLLFVFLGLFFSSCENTVDIDIPFEKPQVTLNATFYHNAFPKVSLTYSRHILDNNWEFEPIKTAEVKLITGNETYNLVFDEESREYTNLQYLVSQNTEYIIEVDLEGYEKVKATQRVPVQVPIKNLMYNGTAQKDAYTSGDDYSLIFDDPEGENFYEIAAYYIREENYINEYGEEVIYYDTRTLYLEPKNPSYESNFSLNGAIILDDKLFEGKEAKIDFLTSSNYMEVSDEGEVYFELKSISNSYYDFQSTYGLQDWNDGDPFAQPVQVYSNIENGIGIFMTGNISSISLKVNAD